ncbi:hypothetical protein ES705_10656 [subsurface metagenome]
MKIEKAIKILNERLTEGIVVKGGDFLDAIRLGIEALKAYEAFRSGEGIFHYPTLLGETPDNPTTGKGGSMTELEPEKEPEPEPEPEPEKEPESEPETEPEE